METLINFFERLIYSLQGLWKALFMNLRTIIQTSEFIDPFRKAALLTTIPNFYLELNFMTIISVGFITFLLVWSLIKVFTNII